VIIRELEWDDDNIEHIHHHKVSPVEVEDVCFGLHIGFSGLRYRYVLYGQTRGGRYLKVVLERLQENRFRPITAFDMSDEDKAHYRRRLK
jgi:uncharacterized DUF497 family protein